MGAAAGRRFETTRWSLVLAAGNAKPQEARDALATLCRLYWTPVYAFIRRSGRSHEDASDLTQAFFARVLEKGTLTAARPERGRFRTFLLTSVTHFLANERAAASALKRGGGQRMVALDAGTGDGSYVAEPADADTPERLYEQRWASTVLAAAMERLAARYRDLDKEHVFTALRPLLARDHGSSADVAAALGMTEGHLRVALHRMRRHYGVCLREVIRDTVDQPEDVDDELRYLLTIVSQS
jgi:RNA polymerase sigma-70 factor (ECF subfamily)